MKPDQRPADDQPLFITFASAKSGAPLSVQFSDSEGPCLLAFSSPVRAADYCRVRMGLAAEPHYRHSTPREFVRMVGDLRRATVRSLALDPCPRCDLITVMTPEWSDDPSPALEAWAVFKGTEVARFELYMDFAMSAAQRQEWTVARDVALELVGHVSAEPPHVHLLLGKLALLLRDGELLQGAKDWLKFLDFPDLLDHLRAAEAAGISRF